MSAAIQTPEAEARWGAYGRLAALVQRFEDRGNEIRAFEMVDPKMELKFIAVPARGLALPFFTIEGMRDHARRMSWNEKEISK